MKTSLAFVGALLTLACITPAIAVPITGSIGFNGTPIVTGGTSFSTSTNVSGYTDTKVAGGSASGSYSTVVGETPVTFSPFKYNSPVVPISPLWTFLYAGLTYSFDALTMVSQYSSLTNTWNIAGTGIAHITGFDATPGTYTFTLTNSGTAFSFASTATAKPVPEEGLTVLMLGGTLIGLAFFARRHGFAL